eukprot:TRINITY_DN6096_c0_g3_i1.p1 TRINITY_DN6096_c0_g3~~TRINITY_DN6096_c0_g3_i1.p1  ORF type:complete len:421 (+),score=73.16 TRINITY_DN6096_c0_g3_i1:431-1693(+)
MGVRRKSLFTQSVSVPHWPFQLHSFAVASAPQASPIVTLPTPGTLVNNHSFQNRRDVGRYSTMQQRKNKPPSSDKSGNDSNSPKENGSKEDKMFPLLQPTHEADGVQKWKKRKVDRAGTSLLARLFGVALLLTFITIMIYRVGFSKSSQPPIVAAANQPKESILETMKREIEEKSERAVAKNKKRDLNEEGSFGQRRRHEDRVGAWKKDNGVEKVGMKNSERAKELIDRFEEKVDEVRDANEGAMYDTTDEYAVFKLADGIIKIKLVPERDMPKSVPTFRRLVDEGVYKGYHFVRGEKNFLIQLTNVDRDGKRVHRTSQLPKISPPEYHHPNVKGAVAFAGRNVNGDSWFINVVDNSRWLGPGGADAIGDAVVGNVVEGLDIAVDISKRPAAKGRWWASVNILDDPVEILDCWIEYSYRA